MSPSRLSNLSKTDKGALNDLFYFIFISCFYGLQLVDCLLDFGLILVKFILEGGNPVISALKKEKRKIGSY